MTFKEAIDTQQELSFEQFIEEYPFVKMDGVPLSLLRLCFFSGYNSAVECVEKIINGDEQFTEVKDSR